MIKLKDIKIGSEIMVRGDFGNGSSKKAIVDNIENDIKNGFPGIDYHYADDVNDDRWAYLSQIDRVIKK